MTRHRTLRLLRRLGAGRRTAKVLSHVAGWTSRIKTPQRIHRWNGRNMPTTPAGRVWLPCASSTRLLTLSMQLDWDHWEHWACVHDDCAGSPCTECGGTTCPHDDDLTEGATSP